MQEGSRNPALHDEIACIASTEAKYERFTCMAGAVPSKQAQLTGTAPLQQTGDLPSFGVSYVSTQVAYLLKSDIISRFRERCRSPSTIHGGP
jgi:hypothetical protein